MELKGENEFYKKLNNKTYNILKVDNNEKIQMMYNIFDKFIKKANEGIKCFIGIDFEFNKVSKENRDVALMQINLEDNSNIGYIYLLYPPNTGKKLLELLTTKNIIKILHGSESLDIPYLFNQLLVSKKNINNFCENFYDTKYLCDYRNQELDNKEKCGIYDLLINNKIINQEKLNELNKIGERLGPLYLIDIDINDMSIDLIKYSLYDVIYLPELLKKFLNKNNIYTKIIPEISIIVNKYKRNVEDEFIKIEKIVSYLNNCNIKNKKIKLIDIYNIILIKINNTEIIKLRNINYFKNFIDNIIKFFIYYNVNLLTKIYNTHNQKINEINFDYYINWLKKYQNLFFLMQQYNKLFSYIIKKI